MKNNIIYFDHASTTMVNPIVLDEYLKYSKEYYANPSSVHYLGQEANHLLERCRNDTLRLLNLNTHQIIYLSGATEANNLAIKGVCLRYKNRGHHIITTIYEHPSVIEAFKQLEKEFGFKVTYLMPNEKGLIDTQSVIEALTNETIFVSIMTVNNEIGAINPIEDIAEALSKYPKVIFHTDACQAIGKLEKSINFSKVDLITVSAHKIHGLVGLGALIKKKNIDLLPLNSGGGQEYNYRSGTNDLAGAFSFKKALEIVLSKQSENYKHVSALADRLLSYLKSHEDLYELNAPRTINPYIINFSTKNKKGSVVVEALSNNGIMVSSVSACHSSKEKDSYVVKSLGKDDKISGNTIRVSFDSSNTLEEVDTLISCLDRIIGEIR